MELAVVKVRQEEVKEQLLPADLRIYEDTLRRFPHNPVALMRNCTCRGCNIEIPMVRARHINEAKKLYRCDSCGRVLINSSVLNQN